MSIKESKQDGMSHGRNVRKQFIKVLIKKTHTYKKKSTVSVWYTHKQISEEKKKEKLQSTTLKIAL